MILLVIKLSIKFYIYRCGVGRAIRNKHKTCCYALYKVTISSFVHFISFTPDPVVIGS